MYWQGQADCLNSAQVIGYVSTLQMVTGKNPQTANVLVIDSLSPNEVMGLLQTDLIKGVVVRYGSLVDHVAVLLNGKGIQLAVVPNLPPVAPGTPILIDGEADQLLIDHDIETLHSRLRPSGAYQPLDTSLVSALAYAGEQVLVHVDGKTAGSQGAL